MFYSHDFILFQVDDLYELIKMMQNGTKHTIFRTKL
jgi:hypothetical protein